MSDGRACTEKFASIYNSLSLQQKQAVDTLGPVLVMGGPGTGKTHILAARIGKILLDTATNPGNILCLTHTNAKVVAMRKRLLSFAGTDAYAVSIHTFDTFCNDIIQENSSLFEKNAMDTVSDLEKIELYKKLIDTFPKNNPLKRNRGDVYYEINNLQSLFSKMKREGLTPQFINQKIAEYINGLQITEVHIGKKATANFKKGDVLSDHIAAETERFEKLSAAVNEFDRFQKLMLSQNRYERDDIINWLIKALEETPALLRQYQQQFLYILVDEYEDISGTENKLIQLLIKGLEKPNIFVAGDDNQSIYQLQEVNAKNMQTFTQSYKNDLLTVVLTDNYRSVQPLLDMSKCLADKNTARSVSQMDGLTKELRSCNDRWKSIADADCCLAIRTYETERQEMIHITLQVEELLKQGVLPERIGVIFKESKWGEELAPYFKLKNISVYNKRKLNILEIPLTKKILLLLNYLVAEHDIAYGGDEMLFEILHFDFFEIPAIAIAKLSVEVADKKFTGERTSLRRLLFEKSNQPASQLFAGSLPESLKTASAIIEKLIGLVPNVTIQNLVEILIRETGILSFAMKSNDKHWKLKVLTHVFEFIKEETKRNPLLTLQGLVNIFNLMQKEGIAISVGEVDGNDKGVNLSTAHGAKGLEFEYVFIAGANANYWEEQKKPSPGYSFPDTMFISALQNKEEEELRRLFYVAITRAQKQLHISYSQSKNDGHSLTPSKFIAEMQEKHVLSFEEVFIAEDVQAEFAALYFAQRRQPEIEKIEEDITGRLLDKFVMNVTALNNYLKCPLNFYFNNLVRVPRGKSEATEFGCAVHHALQLLFEKMQASKNVFPTGQEFINDFNWYMHRHRESFTKEQFDRRLEYGQDVLTNYYDNYINSFTKVVAVERNIRNVVVNDVPLKGKLDKLEFDGKSVNVVDYKTGDITKAFADLQGPNEKEPQGGSYWRQAVFYKILVDNLKHKEWKAVSSEFDFIERDNKKAYRKEKVVISENDVSIVTKQLSAVWKKIQNREFYKGCGKENCHWCNFVKTNNLAFAAY